MATFNFEEEKPVSSFNFEEKPVQAAAPIKPVASPITEPTPEELAAAAKPAFLTKQQFMGGAAKPLEAIRPTAPVAPVDAGVKKPMVKRDFTALDKELESITQIRPMLLPADSRKTRQMGIPSLTNPQVPEDSFTPEKAAKLPNTVSLMGEYLNVRQPNKKHATDPVGIAKEFQSSFVRGDIATVDELTWSMNSTPEQKEIARKAYDLSDKLGTPMLEEVRAVLNPMESPLTYASGGIGWGVKQASLRGVSTAAKLALRPSTVVAGIEATIGGLQNITDQKTKVELGLKDEISYSELALSTGISAVAGKVTSLSLDTASGKFTKPLEERMAALKTAKGKTVAEVNESDRKWLEMYGQREKTIKKELRTEGPSLFESKEQKAKTRAATLDEMSPQTAATKAVLNDAVLEDIYKVTKQLLVDNPELRFDLNDTRVTQGMINALGEATPDMLQQAASKAGVSPADFLSTFKVTLSDAGSILQKSSDMAKFVDKLSVGDPELERMVNRLYQSSSGVQYWTDKVAQKVSDITGASVGASTAAPSTGILNAFSAAFTLAIKGTGDILESSLIKPTAKGIEKAAGWKVWGSSLEKAADIVDETVINVGRMTNDTSGAVIPLAKDRVKADMGQIIGDSLYVFTKIADGGFTAELSDVMLKNNPRLSNMMTHVGAESDLRGLPKFINNINAVNVAVDSAVRRPIFVDSVYRRMKELGLDYEEFIASGRPVPVKILTAAAEDAMKLTMSYEFKNTRQLGEKGFEASMESGAAAVLDFARNNVYAKVAKDIALPFMRYTMNATRYAYRLTPFSGGAGIMELSNAAKLRSEGDLLGAAMASFDGKRKVLDSLVGGAAIGAAMAYRDGSVPFNQYRDQDGNIKDASNLAPLVTVWALADATTLMKDVGKRYWYTLSMSPEERATEANKFKERANAMDKNDPERQELLDKYELMGLQRLRNFDGVKFMEIIAGMGRSAGVQKTIVEKIRDTVEEGLTDTKLKDMAYGAGQFIARYDNVLNPVWEMANAIKDDMRIIETKGETAMEPALGEAGQSLLAPIAAPLPGAKEMFPAKQSPFKEGEQRVPLVARQFLGVKPEMPTSKIENEIVRLGIEPFRVYKSSGDRNYDNLHIKETQGLLKALVDSEISTTNYEKLSMNEQTDRVKRQIAQAFTITKPIADAMFQQKSPDKAVSLAYEKLPKTLRQTAEDRFMIIKGHRPETTNEKRDIISGAYNITNYAKGGFVSKRQ